MVVTREQFHAKLLLDLGYLNEETYEENGVQLRNPYYWRNHARLANHLNPGRGTWFQYRSQIAEDLKLAAAAIMENVTTARIIEARYNACNFYRKASLLTNWQENDAYVEIAGITLDYWDEVAILPETVLEDYQGLVAGNVIELHNDRHEAAAEMQRREVQAALARANAPRGLSAWFANLRTGSNNLVVYGLLFLAIFVGTLLVLYLFQAPIQGVVDSFWPAGGTPPQTTYVQPSVQPEVAPLGENPVGDTTGLGQDGTGVGQSALEAVPPISAELLSAKESGIRVLTMIVQESFIIFVIIMLGQLYLVFGDAQSRTDITDFPLFLRAVGVGLLLMLLPIMEWLAPGQSIIIRGGMLITMGNLQNLITLLIIGSLLWGVAMNGVKDLTPLSVGLFVAGILFWVTQPELFLVWQLPLESVLAFSAAILVHLVEMGRQKHTGTALVLTLIGLMIQAVVFFLLVSGLQSLGYPLVIQYAQAISFLLATLLVALFISAGLTLLSKRGMIPAGGNLTGQLAMQIKTAAHDSTVLLLMVSTFLMIKFWV